MIVCKIEVAVENNYIIDVVNDNLYTQRFSFTSVNVRGIIIKPDDFELSKDAVNVINYYTSFYLSSIEYFYLISFSMLSPISYKNSGPLEFSGEYLDWCNTIENLGSDKILKIFIVYDLPDVSAGMAFVKTHCVFVMARYLMNSFTMLHEIGHLIFGADDIYTGSKHDIMYYMVNPIFPSIHKYEFKSIGWRQDILNYDVGEMVFNSEIKTKCNDFQTSLKNLLANNSVFYDNILINNNYVTIDTTHVGCVFSKTKRRLGEYDLISSIISGDFKINFYIRPCYLINMGGVDNNCFGETGYLFQYSVNSTLYANQTNFDNMCLNKSSIGFYCNNYNGLCVFRSGLINRQGFVVSTLDCVDIFWNKIVELKEFGECVLDNSTTINGSVCLIKNNIILV